MLILIKGAAINIKGCYLVVLNALMCGAPEFSRAEISSPCDSSLTGLADASPPAELAAILNYDCAAAFLAKYPDTAADVAVNMGHPSLLIEHRTDGQAVELMTAVAAEMDRGFFCSQSSDLAPAGKS